MIAATIVVFGAAVGVAFGLAYAQRLPGPFNVHEFATCAFITGVDALGLALLVFVAVVNARVGNAAQVAVDTRRRIQLRDLSAAGMQTADRGEQ
jgi:hypothetical protein